MILVNTVLILWLNLHEIFFILPNNTNCLFPYSITTMTSTFDLIYVDIWGPNSIQAYDSSKYFLTFVDHYTRCTCVYLLKTKSEARICLQNFCYFVFNQFDTKIKVIQSDNDPKFSIPIFYQSKGIIHQLTYVATP